ncbi:hypothetical protein AVEN_195687-1 [Araneus ventricosus]|uniref:Uncharacterized protein n=1 Tax=Araneus ventricosus TaxID=182803 RepID=A0A4Y2BBI6_ARAVE|nr:hypothetical protein AVEN_195687-1 [Araneus ventricosus]
MRGQIGQAANAYMMEIEFSVDCKEWWHEKCSSYEGSEHLSVTIAKFSGCVLLGSRPLYSYLPRRHDFSNLIFLGCDSRVVSTGVINGIIRRLELKLQRPIQWIICLFHFNELPLQYLLEYIHGKTSVTSSYTRDIGRNLKGCERLPLASFNSTTEYDLLVIDSTNLSCDQKYLLDICTVISSGVCFQT